MDKIVILSEQAFTFVQNPDFGGLYTAMTAPISLVVGETYTVEWNGTVWHDRTAVYYEALGGIGLGNAGLLGAGAITDEPFAIGSTEAGTVIFTAENVGTVPISVYQSDTDYLIKGSTLTAIAKAIRAKTGKADAIPVLNMAVEIGNITGGGGSSADVCYVTFMNHDGTVTYGRKAVAKGDDCADPIARGLFSTPTRESTAQYHYTFYGWATTPNGAADANWYKTITENKTVYANFSAALRSYVITYYDSDGSKLKSETLVYGTMPVYVPKKAGYILTGWQPELAEVTGAASYTAQWREMSGFDKLFAMDTEYTRDAAINNAGTLLAVAAQPVSTRKAHPNIYNISGDSPVLLTPTKPDGTFSSLEYMGVSFNFDDTKLNTMGLNSSFANILRRYDVSDPAATAHLSSTQQNGTSPIADSPAADICCAESGGSPAIVYQYPGTQITLTDYCQSMAYSPDGVHLAAGDSSRAAIYNITTGEQVHDLGGGRANKVSYNSDGSLLAVSHSAAPYVSVYETENYTKVCDLGDVMTAAGWAELVGADTLVVGTGSEILVYTITDSGRKDFAYNVPEYTGAAIKDIVKNHSGTRVVIRCETAVEVWSYI